MAGDRAVRTARTMLAGLSAGLLAVLGLAGCGGASSDDAEATEVEVTEAEATSSTVAGSVAALEDGPLEPGRYRHVIPATCDDHLVDCSATDGPPTPLHIDITVPAGWEAVAEYSLIYPASPVDVDASNGPTAGPDGAGLVLGWTSAWVGVNSDPCTPKGTPGGHQVPDTPVGPTVDDFVDAVVAQPALDVTEPVDVTLGGHRARSFTLTVPSDLSDCDNWRPWDPGFFAQGPDNQWDVWAVDVDGFRVVLVAQHFPDTPREVQDQLRAMVETVELGA